MVENHTLQKAVQNATELVSLLEKSKHLLYELSGGVQNGTRPLKNEPPPILTPKEKEIWTLFGENLNVKQIAEKLSIANKTVTVHRDRIRKKLGLQSAKEFYELVRKV